MFEICNLRFKPDIVITVIVLLTIIGTGSASVKTPISAQSEPTILP
jgi:hypothetical protein